MIVSYLIAGLISDYSDEISQLRGSLITQLRSLDKFNRVVSNSSIEPSELELRVKILKMKKVGKGKRLFLGALAGQATLNAHVEIIAAREGKLISSFDIEGKSSGGTSFSGTTKDAIEKAVEQIVFYIQSNI